MEPRRQATHLAEVPGAPAEARPIEARTVKGVESLHSDLKLHIFPDAKLLPQSEINIRNSLRIQILKVAGCVASLLVARIGKAGGVQHRDSAGGAVEKGGRRILKADSRAWMRAC